jgi:transcriptional regulator with XRE-family HTH domain
MSTPSAPAGRGREGRDRLAAALREARQRAGISGMAAAAAAGMSQSKVSKIERGFLLPGPDDVDALSRAYGIPAAERAGLAALAASLREESSARLILARGAAEMQRRIRHLEASASVLRSFQPVMVIGLLQTADYIACVFGPGETAGLSAADAAAAAAAREARQRALDDTGKRFVLIMTEGALRWQAGSAAIMAAQLDAIADAAKRPNVRVGIIPWTAPVRLFPRSGFHLYDEDAVIAATDVATATMTASADVAAYTGLFARLEAAASFGDEAAGHLARIGAEYRQLAG